MSHAVVSTSHTVLHSLHSARPALRRFECLPAGIHNLGTRRNPISKHQARSLSSHPPPTTPPHRQQHRRTLQRPLPSTQPPHALLSNKSPFHTTPALFTTTSYPFRSTSHKPSPDHDRGPTSKEDTQTDFAALNVLGSAVIPTTSVDVCEFDGFLLDSGLRIGDGDGVLLVSAEAFVWRPWMAAPSVGSGGGNKVITGRMLAKGGEPLINAAGQWDVGEHAWGLLKAVWPKPDILIVGTGPRIRPLSPATRRCLQELGMRIEVLDTRNAAAQFNLLATERGVLEVAAALVPIGFGL